MATEIVSMPKLGEMMEEGVVAEWIVEAGETVEPDYPIVTINTDKVDYDVESPVAGTVIRILAEEGATVPVGEPLCEIETPD
jgi:pyruvate/2-oxoglutarate dehydrogenase complex dihydrolipoamide acyltransferase (E2) component